MKHTAFDLFHPSVALVYFIALLVICMTALQPVCLIIIFCAVCAYNMVVRGLRPALRMLVWLVVLGAVIALVNFLISSVGSTEIARLGTHALYLESLVYGTCMGLMLASVIVAFSDAARVLTSDKVMALSGNVVPTVGLMMCMVARLVPQFVRRGEEIDTVKAACSAAYVENRVVPNGSSGAQPSRRSRFRSRVRLVSVLMGLSMENSLDTADSMRARGWTSGMRRTTYKRYRFRLFDGYALFIVAVLAVLAAIATWMVCSVFQFYPYISGLAPWWSYLPLAVYAVLPLVAEAGERARWSK